jgi:hypothetical protein
MLYTAMVARVPVDALVASELVLPAEDTSLDQVRAARRRGPDPRVSGERTRFQPGPNACRHGC